MVAMSRRPSLMGYRTHRSPVLTVLFLAASLLVFRWLFTSSDTDNEHAILDNASDGLASKHQWGGYGEHIAVKARNWAEQLPVVIRGKKRKGRQDHQIHWDDPVKASKATINEQLAKAREGLDFPPLDGLFDDDDLAPQGLSLAELVEHETRVQNEVRLCPDCDCEQPAAYASSQYFSVPVHKREKLRALIEKNKSFSSRSVLRYILNNILLKQTLLGAFLYDQATSALLKAQFSCPDDLISFNFEGLELDKPTAYIYTRTGPGGKLANWRERRKYIERHIITIRQHQDMVSQNGYHDGARDTDRQLVWIIVEDASMVEFELDRIIRESGIPFIYLAHGPTNKFGKAQWNLAMATVDLLTKTFFGDGPVYNLDDDARVLPILFDKIWKVKKAIAWQVGNWPCRDFDSWWEGPVFIDGKLDVWQHAWVPERVFPIDMGGFAINSSMIGPDRPVSGRKFLSGSEIVFDVPTAEYIPFDQKAGETEFLEQIYKTREEMEPLCENTFEENCYYTWHNSWLKVGFQDHAPEGPQGWGY